VRTLALIDSARASGLDISHDVYPYTAFATYSDLLIPAWALAGGTDSLRARLAVPALRRRIEGEMVRLFPEMAGAGLASVQFMAIASQPSFAGRTLADLVRARGLPPTILSGARLVLEAQLAGGFTAIYHSMDERDVERILRHPYAMIESDGDVVGLGMGFPHPRSYGAFPRVLARYVRERGVLTLEEAVRKMTSLTAQRLGIPDRGVVRAGAFADLVVFDPARIRDVASYTDPHHYSVGVTHLLVNGELVIERGALTGKTPGRALVRDGRPGPSPTLR
jgi:N-acyl-D-aspartate/D-glutamate deacylase